MKLEWTTKKPLEEHQNLRTLQIRQISKRRTHKCQKVSRETKEYCITKGKKNFQDMGMVNRAKGNFGIKENGDLKVTLGFGD